MGWLQQLGGLLQQYAGGGGDPAAPSVQQHFDQVAQGAPPDILAQGLATAFRSDQTPPFAQMVGQLFAQSDDHQRAGLLNTLAGAVGPAVLGQVLGGGGGLGGLFGGGGVTPQQAAQISPEAVQQAAAQAETHNPSVVDMVSGFYSQHPGLVKTLGAGALAAAMGGLARHAQRGPLPASQDPYGDPADQQVLPASQDPYGDPADQQVAPASQDPYGDPADQQVFPASQDPYGDPADAEEGAGTRAR